MQRQATRTAPVQHTTRTQEQRPVGKPVPLDPKQLQAVSGGLPRIGGWSTAAATVDTFSPKGTW